MRIIVDKVHVDLVVKNIPGDMGQLEANLLYINPVNGHKLVNYKTFMMVVDENDNFIRFSESLSTI